jgi:multidrug resistance efflux pump
MIQERVESGHNVAASAALSERVRSLRLPQENGGGGTRKGWLPWTLCLVCAASTAVLGFLLWGRQPAEAQAPTAPESKGESVAGAASAPTASSGNIVLDAKGYIIPVQQILVSPKVSGMIVESRILEGRSVKIDEVLAKLEDVDYQADFRRATAALKLARHRLSEIKTSWPKEVGAAEAEMEEARAQLAQAKSDYERCRDLFKSRTAISKQDFELAESKYFAQQQRVKRLEYVLKLMEDSRLERISAAEAEVDQADADLKKAEWRLDNCTIKAPIAGMILKKNAEKGNIVNPIAFNGSFSLCDLADLKNLEVELTIQERDIAKVRKGQKCKVRAEAFPDRVYEGFVSRLMPIADRAKGAIPVRVKIIVPTEEEAGTYLKPEMGALVSFLSDEGSGVRVPKSDRSVRSD